MLEGDVEENWFMRFLSVAWFWGKECTHIDCWPGYWLFWPRVATVFSSLCRCGIMIRDLTAFLWLSNRLSCVFLLGSGIESSRLQVWWYSDFYRYGFLYEAWAFHGSDYEDSHLLVCDAMQRNLLPPSSWQKSVLSLKVWRLPCACH